MRQKTHRFRVLRTAMFETVWAIGASYEGRCPLDLSRQYPLEESLSRKSKPPNELAFHRCSAHSRGTCSARDILGGTSPSPCAGELQR